MGPLRPRSPAGPIEREKHLITNVSTFWLVFLLMSFMATGWFIGYTMSVKLHAAVVRTYRRWQISHR